MTRSLENIKASLPAFRQKGFGLDVSTPRGNYFFNLTDAMLGKYMNAIWGQYSDSSLINIYHTMPEVFAPVHHRAFRIAEGDWRIMKKRRKGADEIIYDNKDLNRLLAAPNPLQTFREWIYEIEAYKCVTGKNYTYANIPDTLSFDYKNVSTLVNLPADIVNVRTPTRIKLLSATAIADLIKSYDVSVGNETVAIPPEKVLYMKCGSLYANDMKLVGKSPLLAAQKAICNLIAVYEARNVIYTKRGALGFIVSKKQDADGLASLTKTEKEELIADYNKTYGLTAAKSPVGITNLPVDYVKVGATIQELQPFDETEASASAVFAVLNVPRSLMPRKEGATYENSRQDERSLYQNIVIPEAKGIAEALTNFLGLDQYGMYIDVSFDHVDVLQENKKEKSEVDWKNNETNRVRFQFGVITLNDWRVSMGLEKAINTIYDKLIYDMDESELITVERILKMSKGGSSSAGDNPNNQGNGNNQA